MATRKPIEIIQYIEEDGIQEPLGFDPSSCRYFYISNILRRCFSHLFGYDGVRSVRLKSTPEGLLHTVVRPFRVAVGTTGQVSVSTTVTLIRPENSDRLAISVVNMGTNDMFIGFTDAMTTTTGKPLYIGDSWCNDIYTGPLYGITPTGTTTVAYEEY